MAYDINEAGARILDTIKELIDKRLIVRTWGNISARLNDGRVLITPSGMDYSVMTADDLVVIDMNGKYDGDIRPSSEFGVHLECYRLRKDVNFVIHTHQTYASALSVLGTDIRLGRNVSERVKKLVGPRLIHAEYGQNGSKRLRKAVSEAIESDPSANHVLMKSHGVLCLGTDYEQALQIACVLERLSEKIYEYYCADAAPLINRLKNMKADRASDADGEGSAIYDKTEITVVQSVPDDVKGDDEPYGQWILHVRTPYVLKISGRDETMKAYLDDLAQIAGPTIPCVSKGADRKTLLRALGGGGAVFIQDDGAYCFGSDYDEALCVAEVLEKGCAAAYLADIRGAEPISLYDALTDRYKYVKKYSGLRYMKEA